MVLIVFMIFFIIFEFRVFFLCNFKFLFRFLVKIRFLIYLRLCKSSKKKDLRIVILEKIKSANLKLIFAGLSLIKTPLFFLCLLLSFNF